MSDHPLDREDGVEPAERGALPSRKRRITRLGWLIAGCGLFVTLVCTVAGGEASQRWIVVVLGKMATVGGLVIAAFGYRGFRWAATSLPAKNVDSPIAAARASSGLDSNLVVIAIWFVVVSILPLNFVLTAFLSDWLGNGNTVELEAAVLFTLLGAFQSEAGLVGIWANLGPQAATYRLPQAGLVLFLVWTSWVLGVAMQGGAPGPMLLLVGAILFLSAAIAFLTCWLGARIFPRLAPRRRDPVETQYSIRTVMTWMVLVATASAVVRVLLSGNLVINSIGGGPSLWQMVMLTLMFGAFGGAMAVAALLTVHHDCVGKLGVWFVCALLAAPVLLAMSVPIVIGQWSALDWRFFGAILCYVGGLFVPAVIVLAGMRFYGEQSVRIGLGGATVVEEPIPHQGGTMVSRHDLAEP